MIKIKTKYDNETDNFTWNYESEHSNTMEHLAIIHNLCEAILQNDKNIKSYKDIFKLVEKVAKSVERKEEITNE